MRVIAQEHTKGDDKPRPAHCHTCWHAALIRCVRNGRIKEAEDLLRPTRVLGTTDEVRRAVANGISYNMGAKGTVGMVRLLLQFLPETPRSCWRDKEGPEARLLYMSLFMRYEEITLLLLQACPITSRGAFAEIAFVMASELALRKVVQALLLFSPDRASDDLEEEDEEDDDTDLPKYDPWTLRHGLMKREEGLCNHATLPVVLAASNAKDADAVAVVGMLIRAMGPTSALRYSCDEDKHAVLDNAVYHGRLDVVRLLVEDFGADPTGRSHSSPEPPLFLAVLRGHLLLVQYLMQVQRASVEIRFGEGLTERQKEAIRQKRGSSSLVGLTPLLAAAGFAKAKEENLLSVVHWLAEEAGADTKVCNEEGFTAAELARRAGNLEVERYLRREEKEEQAAAAASALLAELQMEDDAEGAGKKKSKKARKKEKKKDEEAERERERQKEEEEQKEREKQEEEDKTRRQQAQEEEERGRKEEEDKARRAVVAALMKEHGAEAGFYCLLSDGQLMTDPCIASDGYSYQREALEAYIAQAKASGTPLLSPTTGEAMGDFWVENHLLRSQLVAWLKQKK